MFGLTACGVQSFPSLPNWSLYKQSELLSNYRYQKVTLKPHGSGLADLENVEDCKKFFFMVKGQK